MFEQAVEREGYRLPSLEALFLMKEHARHERQGSIKGEKDGWDIVSLLNAGPFDWPAYKELAARYAPESPGRLKDFLENLRDAPPLQLNRHQTNRLKRQWLAGLESAC